jgi:hypothetical protein
MAKATTETKTKEQEAADMADKLADKLAEEKAGNVTTTSNGGVALSEDQLKMMAGDAGKQSFTIRELMVPVLKICNTAGGVMKASSPEYIKEAKEGQLLDTLTNQLYDPPVTVVIVRFQTNYIESLPKMGRTVKLWGQDRTGYDRAIGGDVGVRVTKDGNEIREVGTYYAMLLRPDLSTLPCLMYLGSTSWKEARRLNALLGGLELMGPDGPFIAPPYARTFKIRTVPDSNEKNTWMTWKFDMGPLTLTVPNGKHYYNRAKELEEAIDKSQTRIVGTQDDEAFAERQAASSGNKTEVGAGPPREEPPPPASEADYGGAQGATKQATDKIPF